MVKKIQRTDEEWRRLLTAEQYRITRQKGTEPPFTGPYYDFSEDGVYLCVACGQELFDSEVKYHSGSGWPSFWAPAAQDAVARYKFTQYYQKYQDWNLVAIAWFAGGSRADKAMAAGITSVAGIADVTGTTIAKYVEKINQYMDEVPDQYQTASFGGFGGGTLTGGTGGGSTREPIPEGYSGVGSGATIGNVAGAGMAGALLGAGSGGILSKLAPTTVQAPYTYQVTDPNSQLEQFLNQPPGTQQQVPGRAPNMESKMIGILQAISNGVANGSGINLSAGPSDRIRLTSERETI